MFIGVVLLIGGQVAWAQDQFGEPAQFPKTKSVKFSFFSPLVGHLGLGYEQLIRPGITLDTRVGIIGVGVEGAHNGNSGVYIGVGPKFLLGQDFHLEGMKQTHPLRGTYFKPEIAFSVFGRKEDDGSGRDKVSAYSGALLLNFGKQLIVAEIISLDFSFGAGYAFGEIRRENALSIGGETLIDAGGYFHSHGGGWDGFPVAFSSTFTVGVLLQ